MGILLVALLVILPITLADGGTYKPRNDPAVAMNKVRGERGYQSECVSCHSGAGWNMPDIVVVYPSAPQQLRLGEPYDLPVQIINPWKHAIRGFSMEVILHGPEQVLTVEAGSAARSSLVDQTDQLSGTVGVSSQHPARQAPIGAALEPASRTFPITLEPNGTMFHAFVELLPHGAGKDVAGKDTYSVYYLAGDTGYSSSSKREFTAADPGSLKRSLSFRAPPGPMRIVVEHTGGYATSTEIWLNYTLVKRPIGEEGKAYSIPIAGNATIKKNEAPLIVPVRLIPFQKGVQNIEFRVRTEAYYKHSSVALDRENYTRTALLDQEEDVIKRNLIFPRRALVVGDAFVPSLYSANTVAIPDTGWQIVAAEMTGFASAGLLVPSLLLGGTYGRGSRQLFNTVLGGAKRRVMYHSLLSMGLSLIALVHMLLFLWESAYGLTVGVLWGGFGALSLLVLGLTGYYQVPLIQRRGFGVWRAIHLTAGMMVLVFVAMHSVLDGPDFAFVKEQLPAWLSRLNLQ